jgi:aspartate/methionine/tyrosine aminotransferase
VYKEVAMMLATRLKELKFSATIGVADKVRELEACGEKIIQLSVGQPHVPTPIEFKQGAISALMNDHVFYSHSRGILELRKLIIQRYNTLYGTLFDAEKNILITPGGKQAIYYFIMSVLNTGDEVIIPTPSWVSYAEIVKMAGGMPVFVECPKDKNFEICFDLIEKAITSRTKAIILNSPNNPTGVMVKKEVLEAINNLCVSRDIFLLSDEVYDQIVFDNQCNASIVSVNHTLKNCVMINSFSKMYSMSGWRIGYILGAPEIIGAMLKFQQNTVTCPTTFAQFGALEAIKHGDWFTTQLVEMYQENRNFLIAGLQKMRSFNFVCPEGTFYLFLDVSKITTDSAAFCLDLLSRCKVAAVPGIAFGNNGEGFIRISFATEKSNLVLFLQRLNETYESC